MEDSCYGIGMRYAQREWEILEYDCIIVDHYCFAGNGA